MPYSKRICILDEIRGTAVILMILYHTLFSMTFLFHMEYFYPLMMKVFPYEPVIPILFISICGIVCSFSRNNLKRGIKIFVGAFLVTAGTYIFIPEEVIICGILHFLSAALLLYTFTEKWISKIPVMMGMTISLLLFIAFYNVPNHYIGILPYPSIRLPDEFYQYYILSFLGFPSTDFYSGDYFPLIPHIFLFFGGVFAGKYLKEKNLPNFMYKKYCPPLDFIGRHALIIYMVHQPVIIGILYLYHMM